jgi:CubicO group peptidase (beta-lactamase class C family)
VITGQSLGDALRQGVFGPLGMTDPGFFVPEAGWSRLSALYLWRPGDGPVRHEAWERAARERPRFLSGGNGLVSTAADLARFLELLRRGGQLDGCRLLAPGTVARMTSNQLPGGHDLEALSISPALESTGSGFGYGVQVVVDPVRNQAIGSTGEYGFIGASGTMFWVDPVQ